MRYQVSKNDVPVAMCSTPGEADQCYADYDADEIREIEDCND